MHQFDYRPEIDGLRALAVLSVIGFHFFPSWLQGGYIGVDIFFVISGYLITSIIYIKILNRHFSFFNFYSKRIKRIFPALLAVLISSLIFGYFSLLDNEYSLLGKHILAGATFTSNLVYWRDSGYFDIEAGSKPLLHLWSLAIEEQFYIVWPFFLWVIHRVKKNPIFITLVICLSSLCFNILTVNSDVAAAFYSPFTRVWELSMGSLIAFYFIKASIHSEIIRSRLSNIFSICGLGLILYSLCYFNKETVFPGWKALLPTIGASLIILSTPKSFINKKIFSSKIFIFVGLISYPLYLWHWPILFYGNLSGFQIIDTVNGVRFTKIFLIIFSIILSYLTYKFIEIPIRYKMKAKKISINLLILLFLTGLAALNIYLSNEKKVLSGYREEKFPKELQKIFDATKFTGYPNPKNEYSDNEYGEGFKAIGTANKNKIIVLGDSHAEQYWNTFAEITKKMPSYSYKVLIKNYPVISTLISDQVINDKSISTVIFSYYWALKYGNPKVNQMIRCCGSGNGGIVGIIANNELSVEKQDLMDSQLILLALKLKAKGKKVIFVLDNPFGEELDPHSLIERKLFSIRFKSPTLLNKQEAIDRGEPTRSRIKNVALRSGSFLIDPYEYLCDDQICPALDKNGNRIYKDYDHISLYSAQNHIRYFDFLFH